MTAFYLSWWPVDVLIDFFKKNQFRLCLGKQNKTKSLNFKNFTGFKLYSHRGDEFHHLNSLLVMNVMGTVKNS